MLGVNLRWTGVPLGRVNDSHPLSTKKTGDKDTGLMALSPLCDSLSLLISKGHDLDKNESTNFKIT